MGLGNANAIRRKNDEFLAQIEGFPMSGARLSARLSARPSADAPAYS